MKCPKCKSEYTKAKLCSNDECVLSTKPWVDDRYSSFREKLKQRFWRVVHFRYRDLVALFRNRFITRSYMVDTGLPKTQWMDKDHVLWLAVSKLFTDYIELEEPFEYLLSDPEDILKEYEDWEIEHGIKESDQRQVDLYQEMLDIYIMIKTIHPAIEKKVDEELYDDSSSDYFYHVNRLYEYENLIMSKIISIRGGMWV
jgi:hypothetical protein